MNFGLMMIWNWITGLVLVFPIFGITLFIGERKYGKDIMDRLMDSDDNTGFDVRALLAMAIASLVWEASFPILLYVIFQAAKELYKISQK
jgi:hypothetical protein